jgi:hypothetical protein
MVNQSVKTSANENWPGIAESGSFKCPETSMVPIRTIPHIIAVPTRIKTTRKMARKAFT